MTVTAMDSQSLTGVTSVTISLLDVNDNTPVFESDTYMFSISEDSREFSVIGVVSATDKDDGENSTISYSIISGNERKLLSLIINHYYPFNIVNTLGKVCAVL